MGSPNVRTATVRSIRVYPWVAFDGLTVDRAWFDRRGQLSDNGRFVVVDDKRRPVDRLREPKLFGIRARFDPEGSTVTLSARDRDAHECDLTSAEALRETEQWLARVLGYQVQIEEVSDSIPRNIWSGPLIVATKTLETVASWLNKPVDDVRARLRANIEIDGEGVSAFWEESLLSESPPGGSRRFMLGQAELTASGLAVCSSSFARDPRTGELDRRMLDALRARRAAELPSWSPPWAASKPALGLETSAKEGVNGIAISVGDDLAV